MKKIVLFGVIVAVVVLLVVLIPKKEKGDGQKELSSATYALTSAVAEAPTVVAWKEDLWGSESVVFDAKVFTTGREGVEALMNKHVDFASMASLPFLLASNKNPELRVVAVVSTVHSIGVVGDIKKGILSVEDLVGKKIGMTAGTAGQFYIDTYLSENGIKTSEVELINLSPPAMLAALERGDIDAVCTWDPHLETAKEVLGEHANEIEGSRQHRPVKLVVATRQDVITKKPETVSAMVGGLLEAEEFVRGNQEEVKKMMVEHSQIDAQRLEGIWRYFDFTVVLDSELVDLWRQEQGWGIESGLIIGDPRDMNQLRQMIDGSFLGIRKPERVTYK